MILWTIKQLFSLKKAFTGRANPSELAWGLALGLAIGLIPKGNLVSLVLIGLLVSLRVNHGMAALSAVAVSFLAFRFDPWTHQLGSEVLQAPKTRELLQRFWDMPLVPWTDLNNTVVMGSTIIGLSSVLPTFLITLPVFRWLAPKKPQTQELDPPPTVAVAMPAEASKVDLASAAEEDLAPIVPLQSTTETKRPQVTKTDKPDLHVVGSDSGLHAGTHVETQIEIIRMKPKEESDLEADASDSGNGPMNEALGYLLRRLRDSRQEKAA